MIRIRASKITSINKVLRGVTKELQAVVNKTTRRSPDRRVIRVQLESIIGSDIDKVIDGARRIGLKCPVAGNTHRGGFGLRDESDTLVSRIDKVLGMYYEGDVLNDDPRLYKEELDAFLEVYNTALGLVKDEAETFIAQLLTDTKTACGTINEGWNHQHGSIVLLNASEMQRTKPYNGGGYAHGQPLNELTIDEYQKSIKAALDYSEKVRDMPHAKRCEVKEPDYVTPGAFWYNRETKAFMSHSEILASDKSKQQLIAYSWNEHEGYHG